MSARSKLLALALLAAGCANRNEVARAQLASMVHEIVPVERQERFAFRAEMRDVLDTAATKRPLGIEWYLVSQRVALGRDLYREANVSWPRIHRGLRLLLERHPHSEALLQEAAFNAAIVGDIHTAHEMLRLTGPRCDLAVWRSRRTFSDLYIWVQAQSADVAAASMH